MSVKRAFPDDWSKISDKEAIEYLKYLLKNYKKYKITFGPYSYISVAGIRLKHNPNGIKFGGNYTYDAPNFRVNNRIYDYFKSKDIYLLCNKLFYACKQEAEKQEKQNETKSKVALTACVSVICGLIIWGTIFIETQMIEAQQSNSKKQIEHKYKEMKAVKTLPIKDTVQNVR
ncbi:MAG: hypothetical protein IKP35_03080 [Alphaproteobacteria bacterium]|nr:hypothetical protein [Alphaproteobacteria bacterium]